MYLMNNEREQALLEVCESLADDVEILLDEHDSPSEETMRIFWLEKLRLVIAKSKEVKPRSSHPPL